MASCVLMGWEDFRKNCQFVVGLGQDGWCGDQPFQLAFPRLIRRYVKAGGGG